MAKFITFILLLLAAFQSEAATVYATRDNERCGNLDSQAPSTWTTVVGKNPVIANWDLDGDGQVSAVAEYSKHVILTYKITPTQIPVGSLLQQATLISYVTGLVQGTSIKVNRVNFLTPEAIFRPTWLQRNSITGSIWKDPEEDRYDYLAMHDEPTDIDHDVGAQWVMGLGTDAADQRVINQPLYQFLPEVMPGSDLYVSLLLTNQSPTGWRLCSCRC